jgi:DNA ligase-1
MSPNKTGAAWTYNVFDLWNHEGTNRERNGALTGRIAAITWTDTPIFAVPTWEATEKSELDGIESRCLEQGLEGIIARVPDARYKFGRSSPIKGPLYKIKRFIDFEAEVIGVYEKMHNDNPAMTNALGRTERSTAKAGKRPAGTLGGLVLRAINGPHKGQEFRCGTGFDDEYRQYLWDGCNETDSEFPVGMVAVIKSFPSGVKELPRFPVFKGFRSEIDLPSPDDEYPNGEPHD